MVNVDVAVVHPHRPASGTARRRDCLAEGGELGDDRHGAVQQHVHVDGRAGGVGDGDGLAVEVAALVRLLPGPPRAVDVAREEVVFVQPKNLLLLLLLLIY